MVLACVIGGVVLAASSSSIRGLLGPGEEVVSMPLAIGQPFALTYVQEGDQKYEAWLEVDVEHTGGYALTSRVLLSENGTAFGQYTLDEDGTRSPVRERNTSKRYNWMSTSVPGSGRVRGTVALFPVPARTPNAQLTISGTIQAVPGTSGTLRLFVAKRD